MEILGIDIGFGFSKCLGDDKSVIFKSLLGDAVEMPFWSDFGLDGSNEYLYATIDNTTYFIGELAEHQSNVRHFTLDQEKMLADFVKVLALTGAGYIANDKGPINVVSGLPVVFFKQNKKRFVELLKGPHEITFKRVDGDSITKKIVIDKVIMVPQPVGSALNLLLDDDGKIINKRLAEKKIGVVDIGFRTTDLTILDHMQYIDRGSRTLDIGMSKAFNVISTKLRERSGVNVELYRMYEAVKSGSIKIRGQEYNFTSIRDQVYTRLAESIANEIDRLWSEDWDTDTIIFTGGGSLEVVRYLTPLITGNMIPLRSDVDARYNNVKGYLKYGHHIWGAPETAK